MQPIAQYVGLDVSLEETKACVVDESSRPIWRGKCASTPDDIEKLVSEHAPHTARIGLETGCFRSGCSINSRAADCR